MREIIKSLACFGLALGLWLHSQAPAFAADELGPYAGNAVIVIFRSGITPQDDFRIAPPLKRGPATPAYTNDRAMNELLSRLGVTRIQRLFRSIPKDAGHHARLDFSRAYRVEVAGSSVRAAVTALSKSPDVTYASADFAVSPMQPHR